MLEQKPLDMTPEMIAFGSTSTMQAVNRVKNSLNYTLKNDYGINDPEITEKFLRLHGLNKEKFDYINALEVLIEQGAANASIDINANKSEVSITGLSVEAALPNTKITGYRYLYRKMKGMYGKQEAKRLAGLMYNMTLAIADSTNILKPYCFAINAQKLVFEGKNWGPAPSEIPQRVVSYIGALCEVVHQLSCHTAGALAIGSFFFDIAYMILFREKKTLTELTVDPKNKDSYSKEVENALQSFIFSMNSLSRNGVETPFTNISIFDRVKIQNFLADDNLGWYYDWNEATDEIKADCGSEENWKEYVEKVILYVQELYMQNMDKGVTAEGGHPFTFPVSTVNFSRYPKEDGTYGVEDEAFLDDFCDYHDIFRFNIYSSEGNKISSCCRLINDYDLFALGGQVNSFGGSGLSLGSHRVITINLRRIALECQSFDGDSATSYMGLLKERMDDASKILRAHRELLKDLTALGKQPFIANGWLELDKMFSTFGLLGYYEANKDLQKFGEKDYLPEILTFINKYALKLSLEQKNPYNIEQIPAEGMCSKCADSDRWIFGEDKVPEKIYSNQFLPNYGPTANYSVYEKMSEEARLGKYLTGGGICHLNIGERITPKQARKLIHTALETGLEHFAVNSVYSICPDNHWTLGKVEKCPKCGKPIVDWATRVVGFMTRVNNWSQPKREEDFKKRNYGVKI